MSLVPSMWQNTPPLCTLWCPHHSPHRPLGQPSHLPLPHQPTFPPHGVLGGAVTSRAPHGLPLTLAAGLCSLIQRCSFLFLRLFSEGWKNQCAQQSGCREGTGSAGEKTKGRGVRAWGGTSHLPGQTQRQMGVVSTGERCGFVFSYFVLIPKAMCVCLL